LRISAWQFLPPGVDQMVFYLADSSLLPALLIPPDSSFFLTVGFKPLNEFEIDGVLVLQCNDPFNGQDSIELHGRGYKMNLQPRLSLSAGALDFGTISVGADSLQSLTVYNNGSDTLIVFGDSLRLSGPAKEEFSLAGLDDNTVLTAGDSSELYIRFQPLDGGEKQAVLHIISNDPQFSDTLIGLVGRASELKSAVIIPDDSHTTDPFTLNQPAVLAVKIDSVSSVDSAFVYLRRAGRAVFTPLPLQHLESGSVWEAQISADKISACGLEYYVCVFQGPEKTIFPPEGNLYPLNISVFIPHMNFPEKTREKTYQMISLPFSAGDRMLDDLFGDDLGNYDPQQYRIFECTDGIGYSEMTELNKPLVPGRAIWLICKDSNIYRIQIAFRRKNSLLRALENADIIFQTAG